MGVFILLSHIQYINYLSFKIVMFLFLISEIISLENIAKI